MMKSENEWSTVRAAVLAEAQKPAATRWWMREAAGLFLVHLVVALGSLTIAGVAYGHAATTLSASTLLFIGATGSGVIATLALGRTRERFAVTCAVLFVLGAVTHVAQHELIWAAPWWAYANCALGELAMAMLPGVATTVALRRFAFQPDRALLGGVAAAATGLLVLDLTCPADGAFHALAFHLVPALVVVVIALLARRAISSRSHVP